MMRVMLYEAAQVMLTRTNKWSWLKAWAMQIARRRGMKKAIVAQANRLADAAPTVGWVARVTMAVRVRAENDRRETPRQYQLQAAREFTQTSLEILRRHRRRRRVPNGALAARFRCQTVFVRLSEPCKLIRATVWLICGCHR